MLSAKSTALLFGRAGLQHLAMLKPMANKIAWALSQPGVTREVLQQLGAMKTRSGVSEWLRTGRVAKKHIPALADLTGTSPKWWLDDQAPIPPTGPWLARQLPLENGSLDRGQVISGALAALTPILMSADAKTRETVGLLLAQWAKSPDTGSNLIAIQALLLPHVPNKRVETNFGHVHGKASK